uniref:Uncharacterized protein n=1 Tax=Arundo donax TaxID=35708 RepID=A0A0A9D9J0_ARUDO
MQCLLHLKETIRLVGRDFLHRYSSPRGDNMLNVSFCDKRANFTRFSLCFNHFLALVNDGCNLGFQLHFPVSQFTGLLKILATYSLILQLGYLSELFVQLFGFIGKLCMPQPNTGSSFINQVDSLVRQEAVTDILIR